MKMIALLSFMTAILATHLTHPVMFMILILAQSINMCLMIWFTSTSSWLSFTLFLIFVGGLMILFIYTTSLASNEKLELIYSKLLMKKTTLLLIILASLLTVTFHTSPSTHPTLPMTSMLAPIFTANTAPMTLLVMTYLLLTLLVTIKVSNKTKGPLRNTIKQM